MNHYQFSQILIIPWYNEQTRLKDHEETKHCYKQEEEKTQTRTHQSTMNKQKNVKWRQMKILISIWTNKTLLWTTHATHNAQWWTKNMKKQYCYEQEEQIHKQKEKQEQSSINSQWTNKKKKKNKNTSINNEQTKQRQMKILISTPLFRNSSTVCIFSVLSS